MPVPRTFMAAVAAIAVPLVLGCAAEDAARPTAPQEETRAQEAHPTNGSFIPLPPAPPLPPGWTMLECSYTNQKTARATPSGSLLGVDVIALAALPQSVPTTTRFIITESETRVEATVETTTGLTTFDTPAQLVMSFNRCGPNYHADPGEQLAIWRFRPQTGWELLGGAVDNLNQLIRVQVTELSRFAIGLRAPDA